MSKVSIYLSSYNYARYLREAIGSVLNQTFVDFELFIVDDASTDESWSIIESYTDPRIRSFRNTTNRNDRQGMRRVILGQATGEYIAIHHSDNTWEPEKLQKQVDFLDAHPGVGAVFTDRHFVDEDGRIVYEHPNEDVNRDRYAWLNFFFYHGNGLSHPSVLIRKRCYDECGFYRDGFLQMADFDMWVRLCMKHEVYVIPEKLIGYRIRSDEMNLDGNRPETRIRKQFEYLQLLKNYLTIPSFEELAKIFPDAQKYYRSEGCDIGYVLGMLALEVKDGIPEARIFGAPVYNLFGLELLFQAINDPHRASRIKQLYNFSHKEFIALTAKYDVFSIELKSQLYAQLAEREQAVQALTAQVVEKEQGVQALAVQVAEKEQAVEALNAQVVAREQAVEALTAQVVAREQAAQGLAAQVAEKGQRLHALSAQVNEIRGSKAWRVALLLRRLRTTVLPPYSARARVAGWLSHSLRKAVGGIVFGGEMSAHIGLVRSSGLFDAAWYLANNPDVAKAGLDPVLHYLRHGAFEGRDPGPNFSSAWYLDTYQDVKNAWVNPLVHFLEYGRAEGRAAHP